MKIAEYIERGTGVSIFRAKANMAVLMDAAPYFEKAAQMLEQLPAADVAPVVHGRWIGAPLCGNDNCRCSECGSWHNIHANLRGEIMQKYCPNCGAKMDGGDNDAAD